jgi:predicted transcriptional regulator
MFIFNKRLHLINIYTSYNLYNTIIQVITCPIIAIQVITCTIVIENTSELVQFYLQWPICVINPYDSIH